MIIIKVAMLKDGKNLLRIEPARSVPPVVPPNLNTIPSPTPHINPPNIEDKSKSGGVTT